MVDGSDDRDVTLDGEKVKSTIPALSTDLL